MIFCVCSSFQQDRFVYNRFGQAGNDFHLDDGARILPHGGGALQLTNATLRQKGHAFYKQPIEFKPSEPVSFSTHFVCALVRAGESSGHGMAFVVSHSTDFSRAEPTRYMGLFNTSSNGSNSTRVLAIELDISLAPELKDISENHVGIDVNSAVSLESANASYFSDKKGKNQSIDLLSGKPLQVWVDYEGTTLKVTIAPLKNKKPSRPLVYSSTINLTEILQSRRMFVGFSGATGTIMSYQYVLGWSFSKKMALLQSIDISKLPKYHHSSSKKNSTSPALDALLGLIAFLVLGLLIGAYLYRRNMYSEVREEWEKEFGPLRDIKASNVMLDAEFNGRLGDFGMSRLYDRGTDPTTTAAVGTLGYMAPELTTMGPSTATDVYAFGVFLLEEVEKVLKLGLLCANLTSDGRPTMEQVVQYLNGNLALPEFWPSSPGIGVLTPMALSPAPLVIPSLSLSSSSSNNSSMFITHSVLYGTGR
ncbi:hypothetical protein AALP_AA8G400000 [Arabis alpina]|uniref:Protein kinase domain-containing protein n=1 Tax=Arabis alpina TaxID=50452 RepID=A0A087GCG0_ARAAL|nr:hypothetical protein AALP_AA8G400000 [Arabis alpina]